MNCRSSAFTLFAVVGLVAATQAALAGYPTSERVIATATILNTTTNDRSKLKVGKNVQKFIGADGYVTHTQTPHTRPIIIIDLP